PPGGGEVLGAEQCANSATAPISPSGWSSTPARRTPPADGAPAAEPDDPPIRDSRGREGRPAPGDRPAAEAEQCSSATVCGLSDARRTLPVDKFDVSVPAGRMGAMTTPAEILATTIRSAAGEDATPRPDQVRAVTELVDRRRRVLVVQA